ncbi:DoxX family protein [Paucibacter sp. PLA-PC-4]|uniref:DoxX family protein n=1 Tax=Paucibacter sp. PLA-PC-4 TaxID=2993655 RepID=UPI002248F429|nr:DoxX family protein [Paucibacter sp. PLA-PC-4]MCX2861898.1 DoxX family protein [Paucibacter sp. PLA-PC-4]
MLTATQTNGLASRLRWFCLLLLCAAYLQGGLVKALDFPAAVGEMTHFGLQPAPLFAVAVIVLELGAAALILTGWVRWLGALALAVFTAAATFIANRYWEATGHERFMLMNAFFEHWGLVGGLLLVAWHDWQERRG